jgi:type IV pilus assembly protein PilV
MPHDMKRVSPLPLKRHARRQHGISLLEVLIAILIFSIGLLGLIGLQARAFQYSVSAEDSNRAALLANEIGSVMWNNNSVVVPAAALTAWQDRVADPTIDGLPNGVGEVTLAGNVADITITWRATSAAVGAENRYVTQVVVPPTLTP